MKFNPFLLYHPSQRSITRFGQKWHNSRMHVEHYKIVWLKNGIYLFRWTVPINPAIYQYCYILQKFCLILAFFWSVFNYQILKISFMDAFPNVLVTPLARRIQVKSQCSTKKSRFLQTKLNFLFNWHKKMESFYLPEGLLWWNFCDSKASFAKYLHHQHR